MGKKERSMHIAVCIKQVPDTKNVRIDPDTHTLVRQGVESIINPFDLFAVEAALKIKDETQARITVLTMGPPQADEALRDVLSRGVDDAVLLSDRAFAGADTWATSTTLAAAIRKLGDVDLILCGKQGWMAIPHRWDPKWLPSWMFPMQLLSRKFKCSMAAI